MPNSKSNSYKQIMKATSIFGGVQVFNILINLIRSKVVAQLLGPTGIGILGLYNVSIGLISSITNFGLGTSAVREIATANENGDSKKLQFIISIFQKLVWLTGFLGMLCTLIFAPLLSKITFGNSNYTLSFIFISITLLLNQLNSGQNVVLQGTRKLKWLATANVISSSASLLITLPLYYYYGKDGIVPSIIISSLIILFITSFFSKKVKIPTIKVSLNDVKDEGKTMLKTGIMFSISGLITILCSYLVRIFISHQGSVAEVGLYNAGFTILGTYVGMVFGAMTTDYYPRLCAASHDKEQSTKTVNEQAEIALLILGPVLVSFIIFGKLIVTLLYSNKFLPISEMLLWGALGMYFRAGSWSMGYLLLAKGNSKHFFYNELISNSYILILNILGYTYLGLKGLGISFLIGYFLHFLQIKYVSKKFYEVVYNNDFTKLFLKMICFGITAVLSSYFLSELTNYIVGSLIFIACSAISIYYLDKRLGFLQKFKIK